MKTKKTFLAALIITASLIVSYAFLNSCTKKAETPEPGCKTCIARDKVEGAPVHNEQVCSDEAEETFRNTYSDYNVTCE